MLAAGVLALALLGDALLYAVLPLHAATFGIPLAWVGVLLAANRVIRLFVYPLLPRVVEWAGLRVFTIGAAITGAASTLWFSIASGPWLLLASRAAWGIAFGALSLATLAYATESAEAAGARTGISLSLRELGPLLSLTAGMLLVSATGVRSALLILGAISLVAVPIAFALPRSTETRSEQRVTRPSLANVDRHDVLSATIGFIADGLFPATIALLLASSQRASTAAIAAGTLLALKRVAVMVVGPVSGRAADRAGAGRAAIGGLIVTAAGALAIACGYIVGGSVILVSGAAVTSTSIPLLAASAGAGDRLSALARTGLARDAGAAAGPLVGLWLFEAMGGPGLYVAAAAALIAGTHSFTRIDTPRDATIRACSRCRNT